MAIPDHLARTKMPDDKLAVYGWRRNEHGGLTRLPMVRSYPMRYAGIVCPSTGLVLDLPNVTSITCDDRDDKETTERFAEIAHWHRSFMKLGREVIVSGARPDIDGIDWIKREKWKGNYFMDYSLWCQRELLNHFSTPFVLVWQLDGFAINPGVWTNDFLKYDYIGPVFWSGIVGNGGFSLRSKRFCESAYRLPDCEEGEDIWFCCRWRRVLEQRGMLFAPQDVAKIWGLDNRHSPEPAFGFHGKGLLRARSTENV